MANNFLLEIGLEEMPAHVVTPSIDQLTQRIQAFLDEQHLTYANTHAYATPRRLAVLVEDIADKQADVNESVKGPAKKIALDADGNWTKAAQGFARGQGMSPDDIVWKEIKGVEYAYLEKKITGKAAVDILPGLVNVITAMTFPTRMRWGNYDLEYIRPIHWIVALFNDQVVPMQLLDIKSGRKTRGHRFLGEDIELQNATDYKDELAKQFVIADENDRKELIRQQIEEMARDNDWVVDLDPDLLEEVTNLVEYPTAFYGHFKEKYLAIPDEVLITSMKDNQRYFYARDHQGKLLPIFIGVRNGNEVYMDNVIAGNEKVLTARLEDADFFYKEDQKQTIAQYVNELKHVTFHDKISSMYDKMQRVGVIAKLVGEQAGLSATAMQDLQRAASIYKFDLVTNMVDEFPELQGTMGAKYAALQGENAVVARAIGEQYMPISADGQLPQSDVGAVLAIADKLDSILAFFAVDMIPNGSNDPYALRRQAYGIVRIIQAKNWHFPVKQLQQAISQALEDADLTAGLDWMHNTKEVQQFIIDRMRQWFMEENLRHDIIDTVVDNRHLDLKTIFAAAQVLDAHKDDADFKTNIESLTRVLRLTNKNITNWDDNFTVEPALFDNDAERKLYDAVAAIKPKMAQQTVADNFQSLTSLAPLIDDYFDKTMIMVDNADVRTNRLHQLAQIAQMTDQFGNLTNLIVK